MDTLVKSKLCNSIGVQFWLVMVVKEEPVCRGYQSCGNYQNKFFWGRDDGKENGMGAGWAG